MNNNQFKRFVRERIEEYASDKALEVIYVDTSASTRKYYFYIKDSYIAVGTMECWLGNNEFHVRVCFHKKQAVSIANYDVEFKGTFMELDQLIANLRGYINYFRAGEYHE